VRVGGVDGSSLGPTYQMEATHQRSCCAAVMCVSIGMVQPRCAAPTCLESRATPLAAPILCCSYLRPPKNLPAEDDPFDEVPFELDDLLGTAPLAFGGGAPFAFFLAGLLSSLSDAE